MDKNAVSGNVGYLYVLLIDPTTYDTIQEARTTVDSGYTYTFNNVPKGSYIIAAGSDSNNDGYICDLGESCGGYLTLEKPTVLNINAGRGQLNFDIGFSMNFLSSSSAQEPSGTTYPRGFARIVTTHRIAQ
jgi:serine protease